MTLCEAYLGIDIEFVLWNYFFRVWHPQDPDAELTISGVQLFMSNLGKGSTPISTFPYPDR
jgi:hypothetical protein